MVKTEKDIDIENSKFNLLIIGCLNFPGPSASSTRIEAYLKCLSNTKIKSYILCLHAIYEKNDDNLNYKDAYDYAHYEYAPGTLLRAKTFTGRRISEIKGLFTATKRLISDSKRKIVILYICNIYQEIFFILLCKLFNIPVIRETSEHPDIEHRRPFTVKVLGKMVQKIYYTFILRGFDGFIVISRYLESLIENYNAKAKLLRIPILIDTNLTEIKKEHKLSYKMITYCGNLIDEKDGINILFQSFKIVSDKMHNIKLKLIGGTETSVQHYKKYSGELGIDDKVQFTGTIRRESIFGHLADSDVLILTRPDNKQSAAGFPTKLGEYLITGNPVVVTNTGEVKYYLEDEVSAFIAEPGNINSIVDKLTKVLEQDKLAEEVGINGQKIAFQYFDLFSYSEQLENYLLKFLQYNGNI